MHLFGDRDEPHLTHFLADRQGGSVVLAWDVRNAPALSWRVLRSERDFAETSEVLVGGTRRCCRKPGSAARETRRPTSGRRTTTPSSPRTAKGSGIAR